MLIGVTNEPEVYIIYKTNTSLENNVLPLIIQNSVQLYNFKLFILLMLYYP